METIQAFYRSQFEKELSNNADLRALEDPAQHGSAAPSTAATDGTPQPTPSGPPTRIKLVSNAASSSAAASNGAGSAVNGGSSAVGSDED